MSFGYQDWKATCKRVNNLPETVDEDVGTVTPIGLVYYDQSGRPAGYIEELGPGFFMLHVGNEELTAFETDLETLERRLWKEHAQKQIEQGAIL